MPIATDSSNSETVFFLHLKKDEEFQIFVGVKKKRIANVYRRPTKVEPNLNLHPSRKSAAKTNLTRGLSINNTPKYVPVLYKLLNFFYFFICGNNIGRPALSLDNQVVLLY